MDICGFRRNRGRSATTIGERKLSVYCRYSVPISPLVNNYFNDLLNYKF